jgi:hypothetical protein
MHLWVVQIHHRLVQFNHWVLRWLCRAWLHGARLLRYRRSHLPESGRLAVRALKGSQDWAARLPVTPRMPLLSVELICDAGNHSAQGMILRVAITDG